MNKNEVTAKSATEALQKAAENMSEDMIEVIEDPESF